MLIIVFGVVVDLILAVNESEEISSSDVLPSQPVQMRIIPKQCAAKEKKHVLKIKK